MSNNNYSTELIDLKDVIITKVENTTHELHVYIELPRKEHVCPECNNSTNCVHDYRQQIIKDIPFAKNTYLHLRKRRYRCPHCGKRFFERNTFLPRYYRMTSRLISSIVNAFRKLTSATDIASQFLDTLEVSRFPEFNDCAKGHDFLPLFLEYSAQDTHNFVLSQ